jgi:ubiquinone/menaquinone biosynthesis C-methylase UbiE
MSAMHISVGNATQAFDRMAEHYDDLFTNSVVGRLQREVVWEALAKAFVSGHSVLELNCGTGEDALFLAKRGAGVVACDASSRMIAIAKEKAARDLAGARIRFEVLSNERLHCLQFACQFDGVLSNFSGLNCVGDLPQVATQLGRLVKPGGRALLCLSTRVCLWEILWYLCHGNFRKAFRRIPGRTVAHLQGIAVSVLYPSKRSVCKAFTPWFVLRSTQAVGLFIPPSYMEEWSARHKRIIATLQRLDGLFRSFEVFAFLGDHVLYEFERTAR